MPKRCKHILPCKCQELTERELVSWMIRLMEAHPDHAIEKAKELERGRPVVLVAEKTSRGYR